MTFRPNSESLLKILTPSLYLHFIQNLNFVPKIASFVLMYPGFFRFVNNKRFALNSEVANSVWHPDYNGNKFVEQV